MSFSVFWNFSWYVHGYVYKICLNKYRVSCIFEQYVINKHIKARTITTIYRILLVQLIRNRLQNHVITTINFDKVKVKFNMSGKLT